jgi:hypothetical protein
MYSGVSNDEVDNFTDDFIMAIEGVLEGGIVLGTTLVLNLSTKLTKQKLFEITQEYIQDISCSFILSDIKDEITLNIDGAFRPSIPTDFSLSETDEEYEEELDFVKKLINSNIKKSQKECFNVDTILDKINKSGIKSLRKEELNYLNNYK